MPNKKVLKLKLKPDYDFLLFTIAAHQKDYRLSWAVNQQLGISLSQADVFVHRDLKKEIEQKYMQYSCEEQGRNYHLIANFSANGHLLPEMKNIDFVFVISGNHQTLDKAQIQKKLNEINIVISAFEVDVNKLKSKKKLADF